KRLVEPALGDDVLVELLAERIPLVDLAPGELRVDARERAADESRLLLLESLQQDAVTLRQPAALVLVAAREGHREQVREALERLAPRLRDRACRGAPRARAGGRSSP